MHRIDGYCGQDNPHDSADDICTCRARNSLESRCDRQLTGDRKEKRNCRGYEYGANGEGVMASPGDGTRRALEHRKGPYWIDDDRDRYELSSKTAPSHGPFPCRWIFARGIAPAANAASTSSLTLFGRSSFRHIRLVPVSLDTIRASAMATIPLGTFHRDRSDVEAPPWGVSVRGAGRGFPRRRRRTPS